jgi:hypothetical protein
MHSRRRFKQTTTLQERLAKFGEEVREKAGTMPAGKEKDALLKRLRSVDTAADLDRQLTPESR